MRPFNLFLIALFGFCISATTASADDVEDALSLALEAYREGDIKTAQEEVAFASQVLSQMKAAGLADFLPPVPDGWTVDRGDGGETIPGLGGASMADANYRRSSDGTVISVQLMAGGQLVAAMSAMFGNAVTMGSMGQVKRINRRQVVVTDEGDIQSLVDNRIMVTIEGNGSLEDKEAFFSAIDLKGLENF